MLDILRTHSYFKPPPPKAPFFPPQPMANTRETPIVQTHWVFGTQPYYLDFFNGEWILRSIVVTFFFKKKVEVPTIFFLTSREVGLPQAKLPERLTSFFSWCHMDTSWALKYNTNSPMMNAQHFITVSVKINQHCIKGHCHPWNVHGQTHFFHPPGSEDIGATYRISCRVLR